MEANFELHDLLDEDLMLLRGVNRARRNRHMGMPYLQYEHFDLEQMEDLECEVEFRFKREEIYSLAGALQLPDVIKCYNGVVIDCIVA